ncbi:non-ribosomal peptide synthetase component F [Nocardioides thalensis]|uniref:Non-ribosomal peptide synthetase component F n=1 Tax=Nocardioides thalensis TaxID=1914755 RepID=A0A853C5S9_9ACTN|nr:GvpL/GvpF family gas vesicle protein [Nocardioides thalensis]NYJ03430.1 non-ribosomal peptide synthetase component F [Nocardioides thalensis]
MGEPARYLYAVSRGLPVSALDGVTGIGGARLEVVGVLDLEATVSTVDLDEFGEEGLHAHLEQLDWVERTARAHDRVVHACAAAAPTAPMRLATVCLDDESVRLRLEEWYDDLAHALDRIAGRQEWSVKVYAHARAGGEGRSARAPEPAAAGGAAYLRRKKAAAEERLTSERASAEAAASVDRALGALAVATRHLRAQDPRLSGHAGTMLLNGAYLVDSVAADEFTAAVAKLVAAHPDVSIACDGPWPPYSFATLEQP